MIEVSTVDQEQNPVRSGTGFSPNRGRFLFFVILNIVGTISLVSCAGRDRAASSGKWSRPPPAVHTLSASSIFTNRAVLNGTVNPNGSAANAWFEYGTDPALSTWMATSSQTIESNTKPLPIRASIPELNSYTTYYYRAAAGNSGGTQRGDIRTFPTGEYYVAVGDSITVGSHDIPATGIGYEPTLSDLLTNSKGYPNTVANRGVSGATSADGANSISFTLSKLPWAKYYLVMYGTNDASLPRPVPSGKGLNPGDRGYDGSYKANLQKIVSAILVAGKTPYLAKVPYTTSSSIHLLSIQGYNVVVDELVDANGIAVPPPDFYTYFQEHQGELDDNVHPNIIGYESMANLWFHALTK